MDTNRLVLNDQYILNAPRGQQLCLPISQSLNLSFPSPGEVWSVSSIPPDQQSQRMNWTFSGGRFDSAASRQCYISSKACHHGPFVSLLGFWFLLLQTGACSTGLMT
ncbi:hypothetical protein KUCAC02_017874 [Chaenocephalus aceratus]|nr:hypothetical protein KUCAC02_017874 [Chaenocephalus aceratus]